MLIAPLSETCGLLFRALFGVIDDVNAGGHVAQVREQFTVFSQAQRSGQS
jgi:hypothetical protein